MLLIDNIDSFTYNIADLLHRVLGHAPTVWRHDHPLEDPAGALRAFDAIVVGPGPGRPQQASDMGLSTLALRQREVPVLGVCLGHQGMAHLSGDAVVELAEPVHGLVSEVLHEGTGLFEGVPSPFPVVRYHSLEVRPAASSPLVVTARALDDGVVMALADPSARRWGVQFHPESVLSEHGARVVTNFLRMAGLASSVTSPAGDPAAVEGDPAVAVGDVHRHVVPASHAARVVRLASERVGTVRDTWSLHQALYADSPTAFWLDASTTALGSPSGAPPLPPAVRCSVLGDASGPLSYVLTHRVGSGTELSTGEHLEGSLLANLALLRSRLSMEGEVDLPTAFRPGLVGYLGYELKAETGGAATHTSPFPDARFVLADRALVVDHEVGEVHAVWLWDSETRSEQDAWVEHVRRALRGVEERRTGEGQRTGGRTHESAAGGDGPDEPTPRHTKDAYLSLIAQCQKEIRAGESYEICLTNTVTWSRPVDETALAGAMRRASPVPFAAWLRGPGPTVISASPERFVSVSAEGLVEARPIKGTRPRGSDPANDAALVAELRTSVKDRAENLMIVDLLRNDLHRVCRSGSVHVPAAFEVETYATVHQLVSTVRGQLAEGMDCLDVIGTCFPGGSMTGAPKVRTMEILDRLEGGPRGVYSGALGWIGLDGAMDLSIVIRTVTLTEGVAEFGVGGAITALSDPEEEYAETLVKAEALTRALGEATVADSRRIP
ncbi:aminodeoxychorismate synthase component I [Ornithinimicrobium cavernae]|uniref:aminodeoxychorismate synthase component I n=1 Tax=Ornithinimicrobium cavernae TaxID=2666047 RepID=UPI00192A65C5|nr:aminodeoxychorismate synthase component I [Ornithinimicrobium cavernae]